MAYSEELDKEIPEGVVCNRINEHIPPPDNKEFKDTVLQNIISVR